MRIAVFTPYLPAPASSGGRIRIYRLLRPLSEKHELHLFARTGDELDRPYRDRKELSIYESVTCSPYRFSIRKLWQSNTVVRHSPRLLLDRYREINEKSAFQGAIFCQSYCAGLAESVGLPYLVDEQNIESDCMRQKAEADGKLTKRARTDFARLKAHEEELWSQASQVSVVSVEDAEYILKRTGVRAKVLPNGACLSDIPFHGTDARKRNTILFTGLMSYPPNVAAATELAQDVLPLVKKQIPDAKLILCGSDPSESVKTLESDAVEVTGYVESVTPYLSESTVFANPLRHGAGSSLKVFEALASGIPLVSTTKGVRGIRKLQGDDRYLPAESAEEFASQIVRVLNAPQEFEQMVVGAREWVRDYDWTKIGHDFRSLVESTFKE